MRRRHVHPMTWDGSIGAIVLHRVLPTDTETYSCPAIYFVIHFTRTLTYDTWLQAPAAPTRRVRDQQAGSHEFGISLARLLTTVASRIGEIGQQAHRKPWSCSDTGCRGGPGSRRFGALSQPSVYIVRFANEGYVVSLQCHGSILLLARGVAIRSGKPNTSPLHNMCPTTAGRVDSTRHLVVKQTKHDVSTCLGGCPQLRVPSPAASN